MKSLSNGAVNFGFDFVPFTIFNFMPDWFLMRIFSCVTGFIHDIYWASSNAWRQRKMVWLFFFHYLLFILLSFELKLDCYLLLESLLILNHITYRFWSLSPTIYCLCNIYRALVFEHWVVFLSLLLIQLLIPLYPIP